MVMWKRIMLTGLMLALTAYLATAISLLNRKPSGQICNGITFTINDTLSGNFASSKELRAMLHNQGMDPTGQPMEQVRTRLIEQIMARHPLVDQAECYKTPGGSVRVDLVHRIPVLRVMDNRGKSYYVDSKGAIMPSAARCATTLPIATGNVHESLATGALYHFANYLRQDPFWDAQIEQIEVLPKGDVELIPRVGGHIIYLGKLTGYERKLTRLKAFYTKALSRVGWNKYSRISVEFDNQVICTKKD